MHPRTPIAVAIIGNILLAFLEILGAVQAILDLPPTLQCLYRERNAIGPSVSIGCLLAMWLIYRMPSSKLPWEEIELVLAQGDSLLSECSRTDISVSVKPVERWITGAEAVLRRIAPSTVHEFKTTKRRLFDFPNEGDLTKWKNNAVHERLKPRVDIIRRVFQELAEPKPAAQESDNPER